MPTVCDAVADRLPMAVSAPAPVTVTQRVLHPDVICRRRDRSREDAVLLADQSVP